jgi:hypothetical protein
MKKLILLLPLVILGASIAGIFILDDSKDESPQPVVKNKKIQKLDRQTLDFDGVIQDYFALLSDEAVDYKNLKVYPIRASEKYLADHKRLGNYLNLAEAVAENKVKIMELGQRERRSNPSVEYNFDPMSGSFDPTSLLPDRTVSEAMEAGASVNTLTIENTSNVPIYIMAGDIVIGGNQDRVIAEDMIAMPNSGKIAVPVFCVEPGRWSPREDATKNAPVTNKEQDGIYAFTGYFNVASNSIRQTVKNEKNQGEVWAKVGDMRTRNNVENGSSTYGDLASSKSFTNSRDDYMTKFAHLFDNSTDIIGCIVVSGDKVLACDIFGTPELFKKQYKVLLHSYVSDAITYGNKVSLSEEQVTNYFNRSTEKYFTKQENEQKELDVKFVHDKRVVHFTDI